LTDIADVQTGKVPPDEAPAPPLGYAALAGLVAAGVALAVTELVSAITTPHRPSVVSAVASRFIDVAAGTLTETAVKLFGTNDKSALLTGILVVSLVLGAVIGLLAARRRWIGAAGFSLFAVLGVLAGRSTPRASLPAIVVACVLGALAGIATLNGLLRLLCRAPDEATAVETPEDPRVKRPDRRTFLVAVGATGAAAIGAAFVSRAVRGTSPATASRQRTILPRPRRVTSIPAEQPFDVPGLSPYITPNADFYRIDTAIFVPELDAATWKLTITGMVDHPATFSYADILAMDLVEEPVTLACVSNDVGGPLVGNASWLGVPLRALLDASGVRPGATQIVGRSVDGFTVGFPTEVGLDGRVAMVAVGMNGEPLPVIHGYPARLVVAGLYGYVSATKWLSQIELTRLEDFDAYWVPRGWAKEAPIKLESRVDVPRSGVTILRGTTAIAGVAWAPTLGISKVEIKIDDGPWLTTRLGTVASKNTWVQWMYPWDATPGQHVVAVRAYDGRGRVQTDVPTIPPPNGATGYDYRGFTVAG
jgi:DMSO/TMAO reductase YedYZ molybdopterin-dependent catalytic subunit